ncbi:MAG: CHASE2 domain-containing protein [Bryobacterales bacterium]|nr:CHASE2 domain-containing protein [Bryobacterales bacterium]
MKLNRQHVESTALVLGFLAVALASSWTSLGMQIDKDAYDWMLRLYEPSPWRTETMLLAIDEQSLQTSGGVRGLRTAIAEGLTYLAKTSPKVVALDATVADVTDPEPDAALGTALRQIPHLVLACELLPDGSEFEDPLPRFLQWGAAIGHVHADADAVNRAIPLEKATGKKRRWALALEAFRLGRNAQIVESLNDLEVAGIVIPARRADSRRMWVRYLPPNMPPVPRISLKQLRDNPARAGEFRDKAVFLGVTAQTATRDRLMTPYSGLPMAGVEIHAQAYETIAQGRFFTPAPGWMELAFCLLLTVASWAAFTFLTGVRAYLSAAGVLASAHVVPYLLFRNGTVFPYAPALASSWLTLVASAAYQHFIVRRRMVRAEFDRGRYQQAMHFVTHEMRTPLTAIQGSSELMGRYALTEEKRKQMAQMINSESKRLGRMIEIFLNVERLSAGEIELKQESFSARELVAICVERTLPLAERKQILVTVENIPDETLTGDRELMEYALYNLLTNAVKYSGARTQVTVRGQRDGDRLRLSVKDQGIGMDEKETRKIFQKFYRTSGAEQSGEAGTGIGLSIVEEIVTRHRGAIEVASRPGEGSCFTLVLPAHSAAQQDATLTNS